MNVSTTSTSTEPFYGAYYTMNGNSFKTQRTEEEKIAAHNKLAEDLEKNPTYLHNGVRITLGDYNNNPEAKEVASKIVDISDWFKKQFMKEVSGVEGDDFSTRPSSQWLVFSEQLYNNGFYDGMDLKDVSKYEGALKRITSNIDGANAEMFGKQLGLIGGIDMSNAEFQMELESAKAGLEYFSEKVVPENLKADFDKLIDSYYNRNKQVLGNITTLSERMRNDLKKVQEKFTNLQTGYASAPVKKNETVEAYNRLYAVSHTDEEKEEVRKAYSEEFSKMSESNKEEILSQVKNMLLDYMTKGIENQTVREYAEKDAERAVKGIDSMWGYVLKNVK